MTNVRSGKKALLDNMRFYILVSAILGSAFIVGHLRLVIQSDQLFYIRLEQIFGGLAILLLYVALIITPLQKIIGSDRLSLILFVRRAIGVSAAYYALLHVMVSLWGQLGGTSQLSLLPAYFIWSFIFGAISLCILLIMAATSFDKAVELLTFPRWKRIHRFAYLAGVLVLLHVWMVGTHAASATYQVVLFLLLTIFLGLEAYRITKSLSRKFKELQRKDLFVPLFLCIWLVFVSAVRLTPEVIGNYHDKNHGTSGQEKSR